MTGWITALCRHVGVVDDYRGFDGAAVTISPDTRTALLRAMGFEARSEATARNILTDLRRTDEARPAAAEVIVTAGEPSRIPLARSAAWVLETEGGGVLAEGAATDHITLPALPLGVHRMTLSIAAREWTTWVIARPEQATTLAGRTDGDKIWGVTTSVYGLTDKGAARIGDYGRLGAYAAEIAAHGADFIGINPVHAMGRTRPDDVISPYSPSHREFLNTWHITPDAPAPQGSAAASDLIDYPAALASQDAAQAAAFRRFQNKPVPNDAFARFVDGHGAALDDYALFEALADTFGADWRDWPAAYRNRNAGALAAFAAENADAILFTKWAQWRADSDLARAQGRALAAGMRVGLYLDLAVGPRLGGAETWAAQSTLVTTASLGAPPDALAPGGQRWGLAPQAPHRLRAEGYAGFARLLRAVMRHAGMIRIDHILGLMRSYWIPDDAAEGAYVTYPFDALLAVVAIESARSGVAVIGEDLGLVPEGLRESLAASGVYGLDVLQYMRDSDGGFEDVARARRKAICAFATHDTPTVTGFFNAADAKLQAGQGAMTPSARDGIIRDRATARATLGDADPVDEIHTRLARANSDIVAIQLDDIAGREAQQNVPGTIDEYPNWRLAAPFALTDIAHSPAFVRLGETMQAHGRANPTRMEMDHGA